MNDWDIAPPPPSVMHPDIVSKMRVPFQPFDEQAALARMQRVTFLRTLHENGAQGHQPSIAATADPAIRAEVAAHNARVATYAVVKAPKPPAVPAPLPVTASVPRAPQPTPAQPSPALAGVTRRTEVLSSLLGARPATPDDLM